MTRKGRIATGGAAVGVVAVILGSVWAFGATAGSASPEPTATMSVAPADIREFQTDVHEVIDAQIARVEAERVEAERVAAEAQAAADAEAARVAAEQAAGPIPRTPSATPRSAPRPHRQTQKDPPPAPPKRWEGGSTVSGTGEPGTVGTVLSGGGTGT